MSNLPRAQASIWWVHLDHEAMRSPQLQLPASLNRLIRRMSLEAALKLLAESSHPQIIFLESRPDKAGQNALTQLQDRAPEVPILFVNRWANAGEMQVWLSRYLMGLVHMRVPGDDKPSNAYQLSKRELEILRLMVKGLIKKEIAEQLSISFHTVGNHERHIFEKLSVHTRSAAVAKCLIEKIF
jgi:DNA-binding NarL/FixJ family response regulator